MKKVFVSLASAFAAAAALVCFAGCDGGYKAGGASFSADSVRSIEVEWVDGNVWLSESFTDEFVFSEETTASKEEARMHYKLERGVLKIKFQKPGLSSDSASPKQLRLSVPKKIHLKECEIDSVAGDVFVAATDFYAEELDLKTVSGNISVAASRNGMIEAKTVSGNIEINAVIGAGGYRVEFDTLSGAVDNPAQAAVSREGDDTFYTYGNGTVPIKVETVSGKLILNPEVYPSFSS